MAEPPPPLAQRSLVGVDSSTACAHEQPLAGPRFTRRTLTEPHQGVRSPGTGAKKGFWNAYPLNGHWDFQLGDPRAMQLGEYGRRLKLRRLGRNVRLGGFGQGVERLIAE